MAKPVKQLRDLLREKQEPFMLDLYLLEKEYSKKRFDSRNLLQSCDPERGQKGSLMCSKVLRDVCNQVISFNGKLRIKNANHRDSSASSSTCSASDGEETSTSQRKEHIRVTETMRDRKLQSQCIEETRQLSPVSVLEEVPSNRDGTKNLSLIEQKDGSIACTNSPRKITEDSIISASLWRILGQSEIQEIVHSNLSQTNIKQKKVVQQTRQLLFDCVAEIVETHERKKRKQQKGILVTEDFVKLIEEKMRCRGKPYNSAHLLEMDFWDSAQEWISFKPIERRIGCEIGDAILEEMMNEFVVNMIDLVAI